MNTLYFVTSGLASPDAGATPVRHCAAATSPRDRVLTEDEEKKYLAKCKEPWKTIALIMLDQGLRPGEIRRLRIRDLSRDDPPRILVRQGKSKAARRGLPMTDQVADALTSWSEEVEGKPDSEWPFPSKKNEHVPISAKVLNDWHQAALKDCEVMRFEPYCMRHTALTRLAAYCDVSPFRRSPATARSL